MRTTSATNRQRAHIALCVPAAAVLLAALTLGSCRKDLCYDHDTHSLSVKVRVLPEWEQEWEREYDYDWEALWRDEWTREYDDLRPETADGIRALAYAEGSPRHENNLPTEGGRLALSEGMFDILFYNNDTEYIVFEHTGRAADATASTRPRSRSNFQAPQGHEDEPTIGTPDMLYASYVPEYDARLSATPGNLPVSMYPRTYAYLVRYRFRSGLEYVAQASGSLSGMADKTYLSDGHTDTTPATLLFDCQTDPLGCRAKVLSFGVPGFAYKLNEYTVDPASLHFVLGLEVTLKNGRRLSYHLDVSDAMRAQPRGGILLFPDIDVSGADGDAGSGAFDPEVDGWEDATDIPLPID